MTDPTKSRRTALKFIGATAAATGLTSVATAQDNESESENGNETDTDTDETDAESGDTDQLPIVLAGRREYWYGVAPEEIEGEENPALDFEEGQEYELVWLNVDGHEHELIVESEDGEELEASDSSETAGEAISMTFEPSENAAEYYCEYHPDEMRGDVELGDGFDLSPDAHHAEGMGNESAENESMDNESMDNES